MPVQIKGAAYHSASEVAELAGVSRQTLWRWRNDGDVPSGRRYRNRQLLFTEAELVAIRDFADRIEPARSLSSGSNRGSKEDRS
jgi:predicted DNA-binding transcriptional regulator AlpA